MKCFLWNLKFSPWAIVQVRIYLWQLSYSTQCIYDASVLEMLFSWLTFIEWETNREKKMLVKGCWVTEHTHRLRNRHGPMEAQRCLGAKTNSPRKFALVSCFEVPKQTQNELHFGLILFKMTSYQFVLWFRLKYIRALTAFIWPIPVDVNVYAYLCRSLSLPLRLLCIFASSSFLRLDTTNVYERYAMNMYSIQNCLDSVVICVCIHTSLALSSSFWRACFVTSTSISFCLKRSFSSSVFVLFSSTFSSSWWSLTDTSLATCQNAVVWLSG